MNVASACIFFFLLLISAQTANAPKKITFIKPGNKYYDTKGSVINAHGDGFVYYKKKYYRVGEYKTAGAIGDTAQVGVSCYPSKDLLNWKNEGIAFGVSADALHPVAKGCILERPTVVYNQQTAMFVMWFHLEPKGGAMTVH